MKDLVEYIVKELVDKPDEVEVAVNDTVISVKVAQGDMGKIIGKQGRIAKSIRSIVKAGGMKKGIAYTVEILE